MSKEEINELIYSKLIPIGFVWEDDMKYNMFIYTGEFRTSGRIDSTIIYPIWCEYKYIQYLWLN